MASLKVADPLDLSTVHYYAMHTKASAMQTKTHEFSSSLNELEHWSTIVPNLSRDQGQVILEHLQERLSQLTTFEEPHGTRQQQFLDLERLAKLQKGPLAKMMYDRGFLRIMDDIICKRLRALSGETKDVAPEVLDSTDTSGTSTPNSSVGAEPVKTELYGRTALMLKSAAFTPSSSSYPTHSFDNAWICLEDDVLLLSQGVACRASIAKGDVSGVARPKNVRRVVLEMGKGKGNWSMNFEHGRDADALRSWFRD